MEDAKEVKKETKILNLVLTLLAVGAVAVAGWTALSDQFKAGTDDLFLVLVCLLLALLFAINPLIWAYHNGYLRNPLKVEAEAGSGAAEGEMAPLHVEHVGSTKLFVNVWIALLAITFFEVFLAYIDMRRDLMLIILMGGSIVKAALIIAYFMHLRFERLSLVLTLIPAMVICLTLLAIFFPDSIRLYHLR